MEAEKISNFLRNPEYSNDNKLEDLTEVIQKYPYFQSARFLFLSELKNKESFVRKFKSKHIFTKIP